MSPEPSTTVAFAGVDNVPLLLLPGDAVAIVTSEDEVDVRSGLQQQPGQEMADFRHTGYPCQQPVQAARLDGLFSFALPPAPWRNNAANRVR